MAHPYYGLNELREMFLSYFESQGHLRLPSWATNCTKSSCPSVKSWAILPSTAVSAPI